MTAKETEKAEAIAKLRELLPPGSRVRCVLRHVSRSGMLRHIDVYAINEDGMEYLSGFVAKATGYSRTKDGAIKVHGCGMDAGFEIVSNLGYALYGDGFTCLGERCPSNDHSNGDRNHEPHHHSSGGYALQREWI